MMTTRRSDNMDQAYDALDRIDALLAQRNLVLRELSDAQDLMTSLRARICEIDREVELISRANRQNSV